MIDGGIRLELPLTQDFKAMAVLKQSITEMVKGCKEGKRTSQETLYKYFSSKMFGVCLRYSRDRSEAEDILQMTFIKVFENIKEYTGAGSFEGWVRRITVNTAIEMYRKNKVMNNSVDISMIDFDCRPVSSSHNLDVKDMLRLIARLPDHYRVIFNMFAIEGYSHREIAETLGITETACRTQLHRARHILQDRIRALEMSTYHAAAVA